MNRRTLVVTLALAACACCRSFALDGRPEPWQPIDTKFKGCEGG